MRLTYKITATLFSVAVLTANVHILTSGEAFGGWVVMSVVLVAMALVVAVSLWVSIPGAVPAHIVFASVLIGMLAFEGVEIRMIWGKESVGPNYADLARIKMKGVEALPLYFPSYRIVRNDETFKVSGKSIVPFSEIANANLVLCREGDREFALYRSDKMGYKNPKGLWKSRADVVLLGDSFVHGQCVESQDHFAAQIRARFPATVNLGASGTGPLSYLGALREYGRRLQGRIVLWFYDEHNDLFAKNDAYTSDLELELKNPILRRYLEPGFTQGLLGLHTEIQSTLRKAVRNQIVVMKNQLPDRAFNYVVAFLTLKNTAQRLPGLDKISVLFSAPNSQPATKGVKPAVAAPPTNDGPGNFRYRLSRFEDILRLASAEVAAYGGRLAIVHIPEHHAMMFRKPDPRRKEVSAMIRGLGLDIIDIEAYFRKVLLATVGNDGAETLCGLLAFRCGGHYGEEGYRLVGEAVLSYLDRMEKGN